MTITLAASYIFFFNDTAPTEIYTLSLHDALPISRGEKRRAGTGPGGRLCAGHWLAYRRARSEEHTSELQSQSNLVCRLLLEKKKTTSTSADKGSGPACRATVCSVEVHG